MKTLYKKELNYYLNNPIGYIVIILFAVFANFLFVKDIFVVGSASMRGFFGILPWLFLVFIPALTMRIFSEEKRLNTIEVLLTLPISETQIVVAKFFALLTLVAIGLGLTLGLPISLSFLTKIYLPEILVGYLGLLLLAAAFISFSMFFSSQTKNQVVALLVSVIVLFSSLVLSTDYFSTILPKFVQDFLIYFAPLFHLQNFTKGIIDWRSLFYFIGATILFLFLTIIDLEKRGFKRKMIYVLALVIFIGGNILISSFPFRLDLSYGHAYSLSSSTKKILKNLDDIVTIKFFASSDLPTRLLPLKNDVVDFLGEYQRQTKKINLKILDPKKDAKVQQEVKELGVPELQFSQLEKDKYAVTNVYFGIVLAYKDKKEIIPQVTDLESLEYNLTASIYKLTRKELVKVGTIGQNQVNNLQQLLRQQFIADPLDISSQSAIRVIDPSYKTVLIFDNNKKEYDKEELTAIKAYLNEGGKAIFFVDGVWVADNLTTQPAKNNLSKLIEDFGIKVENNLVLSTSAELVNFGNQMVQFLTPYPFWVKTNNFNLKTSYFSNINQLTYPWVSSISWAKKNDIEVRQLIKTSKRSWVQKDAFVLNPQNIPQPNAVDLKEYLITASAKKKNGGELVVIPSSRFILDGYLSRTADNLEFVWNVLNDLASGGVLSGIRQRAVSFYPLPDLPETQKDIFKYLNILLLPSLFGIFGTVKLLKRR